MRPLAAAPLLLLLSALAGCASDDAGGNGGGPATSTSTSTSSGEPAASSLPPFVAPAETTCPGHWHVTFAVYVPGADGQPDLLDLSVPKLQSGRPYYDFGVAPNMTVAAHLHQSGPERGEADLGPFQVHHEASGKCTGIAQALRAVDVEVGNGTVRIAGAHRFASQAGTWNATDAAPLRILIQSAVNGTWVWREADVEAALGYQPLDGESYLVAIGPFTDAALRDLAGTLPAPVSRVT